MWGKSLLTLGYEPSVRRLKVGVTDGSFVRDKARPQKVYKFPLEGIYISNDRYIPIAQEVYTFWERMGIGI